MFEDVTQERSSLILLSLTDESIIKHAGFKDFETKIIENFCFRNTSQAKSIKGMKCFTSFRLVSSTS